MGDYRFTFRATFEMGDVKDSCDSWCNYSPGDLTPIDRRVEEWLSDLFERGKLSIDAKMDAADDAARERQKLAEEDRILAEAERIKEARRG